MAIYGNMVVPSKARGAGALPTDNSDRNVYVAGTDVSGRFSDAGGVLAAQAAQKGAEGLQGLAKGVGALGPMFVNLYDRQKRLDMTRAQEAVTRLQTDMIRKQTEWGRLKGADAVGANGQPDIMARYASWRDSTSAPKDLGEFGQRYYNMHADRIFAQAESWGQRYQDSQLDAYQESTLKAGMQANIDQMALSNGDPQQWAQAAGQGRAQIEMMGQRLGWSQEVIDSKVKEFETKGVQGLLGSCLANGDLNGALQAMNLYGPRMGAQEFAQAQANLNSTWKQLFGQACQDGNEAKMKELMDWAQSAKLRKPQARASHSLGGGSGAGAPVINGWSIGALSHKHESGGQSSRHISFGLWKTDGIDVGKYSFITGGADAKVARSGGSVGDFIRWVRDKSPAGARLYEATMAFTGGDWSRLNAPAPWKSGGAMQRAWHEAVDSGEIEALENRYTYENMYLPAMRRLAANGEQGRKTYELIMSDKTGALQSVAFSTIMQHKKSVQHLTASYDPDPATFLRKLGERRADPQWYGGTGMSNLGRKRQSRETPDALYMLTHAGPLSQDGTAQAQSQPAQASGKGGDNIITAETLQGAEADYAPVGLASSLWSGISKLETQEERARAVSEAVGKIDNPVLQQKVESFLAHKLKISGDQQEAADSAKAQEVLPMIKGMGREEARVRLQTLVDGKTITQAQAARVYKDAFEEPKDNPETRAALNQLLYDIDDPEKKIVSRQQLEYICMDRGLTNAQTHEALKYFEHGGSAGKVKIDDVKEIYYNEILEKGFSSNALKVKNLPDGYLNMVLSLIPKGKIATRDELKEACVNAAWKSNEWFGGRYFEHVNKTGSDEGFVPDLGRLTATEIDQLRGRAMETFGVKNEADLKPEQVSAQFMKERGLFNVKRINRRAK